MAYVPVYSCNIGKHPYKLDIPSNGNQPIRIREKVTFGRAISAEVQKGVEHGSIAPRRKWTELILAEGFGTSLPQLSQFRKEGYFFNFTDGPNIIKSSSFP